MLKKADLLKIMLQHGRSKDLLQLMEGESKYTSPDSELFFQGLEESRLWHLALSHVRFVARFGLDQERVIEDGKVYRAYSEEFAKWIFLGAPGLPERDFLMYLSDNPIVES